MITREAKFYLVKKESSSDGLVTDYHILLEDADGEDVGYIVNDQMNNVGDIAGTIISNTLTEEIIPMDSYLGKKIIDFVESGI